MSGVHQTLADLVRLKASARNRTLLNRRQKTKRISGQYLSVLRGAGMEFDEVRAYQPGDEVRTIDWRVSARRGVLHTKTFREEKERPFLVMTDLHAGMYFGTRQCFKSVLAMRIASLVAWIAVEQGDRVGGLVSGIVQGNEQVQSPCHAEVKPQHRSKGAIALLHALTRHQPTFQGQLMPQQMDKQLQRLTGMAKKGGYVVIISDFQEAGDQCRAYLSQLSNHHQVIVIFVYDTFEEALPRAGMLQMGMGKQRVKINTDDASVRTQWAAGFRQRKEGVRKMCQALNIRFMTVSTEDDVQDLFVRA